MRVLRRKTIRSTQDTARRLAERGAPAWTVVRAERQTAGRGRLDRRWSSGKGGVYLSVVLRPRMSPRALARLSLRAGRALAEALGALSGLRTRVKPPNDVLARAAHGRPYRKVCGVLIEASGAGDRLDWLVIGVGVNAANRTPRGLPGAASLTELRGRPVAPERVFRAALRSLRKIMPDANKRH